MINIPSILNGATTAYRYDRGADNWNSRGQAPLSLDISAYHTYGDGTTQHSGHWCVQFADLVDVCLSFARAIVADPLNEGWKNIDYTLHGPCDDVIRFALSVKHKEPKDGKSFGDHQFFSVAQNKITKADKRYDKRFQVVESWHDGTPKSAFAILCNECTHYQWLSKVQLAVRLREIYATVEGGGGYYVQWEDVLKPLTELKGDWQQAFEAYRNAVQVVRHLDHARRLADCAEQNSKPKAEAA
jgi:hypothetical protein